MAKTLHLIAPFHDVPAAAFSQNAFAAQSLTFPKMMQWHGYTIAEYANEGSESAAADHCTILSRAERVALFPHGLPTVGSPGWSIFEAKLRSALRERVQPGDVVLHTFGAPHAELVRDLPQLVHVEPFVGYLDKPFGAHRVYQSEAWRNYHFGLADAHAIDSYEKRNTWMIPMGFDVSHWPCGTGAGGYVLFFGKLVPGKGLDTLGAIIRTTPWQYKLVGVQSRGLDVWFADLDVATRARVEILPPVTGAARAALLGDARCVLMPTVHVEPFGAGGVEAMMCGTPLIASAWGAFVETVEHKNTGFLCRTVDDYERAIDTAPYLDRVRIAARTRARFSLERVGVMFDEMFTDLLAR